MKRIVTLSLLLLAATAGRAQLNADTTVIDAANVKTSANIAAKTMLFIDSTASLSAEDAVLRPFYPLENLKNRKLLPPPMVRYAFFLKFSVINNADTSQAFFLFPGVLFTSINLYTATARPEAIPDPVEHDGYRKINLFPHQQLTLLVRLKPLKSESDFINPQLIRDNYFDNFTLVMLHSRSDIKTFGYVLSGVLLMMILFMGTNYILSYKKEFLYNAMYSLCMFLLIYFNSYVLRTSTLFTNFFMSYFDFFLLVTGTIFYIGFTRKFLDTGSRYLFLDKTLKYGQVFLFLMLVIYSGLHFFTDLYPLQVKLEYSMKFLCLAIGVFFIVLAFKQRNTLFNYLAFGNAALVLFSAISLEIIWSQKRSVSLLTSSLFYYYMGIVLELFFFLLGLTYKNRHELIERTKEQEALKLQAEKKEYETQITIMKAQQEERNRISADMHDDLGAGMTTIRLYSELARAKLGEHLIPEIDKISSSSDELLNKMNAIIWSMSSSNDSLGNMVAYIRSYAIEYFENTGIDCRMSLPDDLPNIEVIGEIRRNVFLVVKEALNNALKHSKATAVDIILERVPGGLTLYIHDNGIGINIDKLRQFGNGLKNMKKRGKDIGVEFSIENKNGTLITLHRKIKGF